MNHRTIALLFAGLLAAPAGAQSLPEFATCTIAGSDLGLSSANAGVVANLNRADLTPDFIMVDRTENNLALAVTDPIAMRRVDCLRAVSVSNLVAVSPRAVDVLLSNDDLNLDIAVAGISNASVFFGDGLGGTASGGREIPVSGGSAIVAADITRSGQAELLIGTVNGNNVEIVGAGADFPNIQPLNVGAPVVAVAVADFDGDGRPDVLVLDQGSRLLYFRQNPSPPPTPSGTPVPGEDRRPNLFLNGVSLIADDPTRQLVGLAVADPDGPERLGFDAGPVPDIAVIGVRISGASEGQGELSILLGSRAGAQGYSVLPRAPVSLDIGAPSAVAVGDLDADGNLDVVVADSAANHVLLFRGNGTGGLGEADIRPAGGGPSVVLVADFDSDDRLDIAVGDEDTGSVTMFLSNRFPVATFTFTPTETPTSTPTETLTPSLTPTPSETPTQTPTNTGTPTQSQTVTRTTTPGFFDVRGDSCLVIASPGSSTAWPLLLVAAVLALARRRGAYQGRRAKGEGGIRV